MLYFPIINPIIFQPLFEKIPATAEPFQGHAQVFPSGAEVQIQLYQDYKWTVIPKVTIEYDDGTRMPTYPFIQIGPNLTNSKGQTFYYIIVTCTLPAARTFRLWVEDYLNTYAVSGCITTLNNMTGYCKLSFGGNGLMFDACMSNEDFIFRPTVYVKGGFFTSGFSPVIEGEEFIDGNRVSRYLSAWPAITRDFIIGGPQGVDNRLVAMLNVAFCLPSIEIDGQAYVRYAGAELKSLGNKSLPCRAWSITLQHADGDYSTCPPDLVSGVLMDASGRYLVDAIGQWIQTN